MSYPCYISACEWVAIFNHLKRSPVNPDREMKERTKAAAEQVAEDIARRVPEKEKLIQGKLLKGRWVVTSKDNLQLTA